MFYHEGQDCVRQISDDYLGQMSLVPPTDGDDPFLAIFSKKLQWESRIIERSFTFWKYSYLLSANPSNDIQQLQNLLSLTLLLL